MSPPASPPRRQAALVLGDEDASLLDIVDNVLSKGVVLTGDLTLGLANVDLVYARLSLVLAAADRILAGEPEEWQARHAARRRRRVGHRGARRRA